MFELIYFFLGIGIIIGIGMAISSGFLNFINQIFEERKRKEIRVYTSNFGKKLTNAINNNAVQKLKDISDLYLAHIQSMNEGSASIERIRLYLRISKKEFMLNKEKNESKISFINRLLEEIETDQINKIKQAPFVGVPREERSLLIDIYTFSEAITDQYKYNKLKELGTLIKVRHEKIEKLMIDFNKANRSARIGTRGTIIFGLISVGVIIFQILKYYGLISF